MAASYNTDAVNRVTEEVSNSMHDGAAPATVEYVGAAASEGVLQHANGAFQSCFHSFGVCKPSNIGKGGVGGRCQPIYVLHLS
ncbi:unnamed protein product [Sphagnum jensenii]